MLIHNFQTLSHKIHSISKAQKIHPSTKLNQLWYYVKPIIIFRSKLLQFSKTLQIIQPPSIFNKKEKTLESQNPKTPFPQQPTTHLSFSYILYHPKFARLLSCKIAGAHYIIRTHSLLQRTHRALSTYMCSVPSVRSHECSDLRTCPSKILYFYYL